MYIVLGASGHVGGSVARTLLESGQPVTAVLHDERDAAAWRGRGARPAIVDVHDAAALRAVFQTGTRAFLLNPPANVAADIDVEERATARSIVAALDGSGLDQVAAASTYGAQPGERCGDLTSLYYFEQALAAQPVPAAIQRGAYYMSNVDALLQAATAGKLPTMLPPDLRLPMVAPADLGVVAARRLTTARHDRAVCHIEGPARYCMRDVATAFAAALGHPVEPVVTPRAEWEAAYRALGFSAAAATSFARMTAATVDAGSGGPARYERGDTTLGAYIADLVDRGGR